MREAFNALNDIVVQFTTARGSAQRVFEMVRNTVEDSVLQHRDS